LGECYENRRLFIRQPVFGLSIQNKIKEKIYLVDNKSGHSGKCLSPGSLRAAWNI
jgi:hypothetical protein